MLLTRARKGQHLMAADDELNVVEELKAQSLIPSTC